MQVATETLRVATDANLPPAELPAGNEERYAQYKVIRRNGAVVGFEPSKIVIAMTRRSSR